MARLVHVSGLRKMREEFDSTLNLFVIIMLTSAIVINAFQAGCNANDLRELKDRVTALENNSEGIKNCEVHATCGCAETSQRAQTDR